MVSLLSYYVSLRSVFRVMFANSGVQHIMLCFVSCFRRLVYPILPVSLDYHFLIDHSVFSNVYFLRVVYPILPASLDYHFLIDHSVFSNVYCLRVVYPILLVSLDYNFLIDHSILSNVYCLRLVHSIFPVSLDCNFLLLRYFLTCIVFVLCPLSSQCLWIVIFLLLRYFSNMYCNVFSFS